MEVGMKIRIGVRVMEKKVKCGSEAFSGPMTQILDRLQAFGEFEVIHFGDKVIVEDPIESWPICDCLIAFYSEGYPLEKAEAYVALRKPFLVNELQTQHLLHDRIYNEVGNRSSEFHPDVRRVRRAGSYIYEEFMPTGGTDVNVSYL